MVLFGPAGNETGRQHLGFGLVAFEVFGTSV